MKDGQIRLEVKVELTLDILGCSGSTALGTVTTACQEAIDSGRVKIGDVVAFRDEALAMLAEHTRNRPGIIRLWVTCEKQDGVFTALARDMNFMSIKPRVMSMLPA